ncbi:MAG: DUF721 domain-containing protein [Chromatiaceae bacterium]|nr:DUF721 domain-containing protein [Chromatiaceae bacterium]
MTQQHNRPPLSLRGIADLLDRHPLLREPLARERQARELLVLVCERIPADMAMHCLEARLNQGTLRLLFDSPAWTTRARFLAPDLIRALGRPDIARVECRATLPRPEAAPCHPAPQARGLSAKAAAHLRAAALDIEDASLAAVLRRLASRHRPEEP